MEYSYEERRNMVINEVFEKHTNNGHGMDWDEREEALKNILGVVANSYYEEMTIDEWVGEAMRKLGH